MRWHFFIDLTRISPSEAGLLNTALSLTQIILYKLVLASCLTLNHHWVRDVAVSWAISWLIPHLTIITDHHPLVPTGWMGFRPHMVYNFMAERVAFNITPDAELIGMMAKCTSWGRWDELFKAEVWCCFTCRSESTCRFCMSMLERMWSTGDFFTMFEMAFLSIKESQLPDPELMAIDAFSFYRDGSSACMWRTSSSPSPPPPLPSSLKLWPSNNSCIEMLCPKFRGMLPYWPLATLFTNSWILGPMGRRSLQLVVFGMAEKK